MYVCMGAGETLRLKSYNGDTSDDENYFVERGGEEEQGGKTEDGKEK